MIDLIISLVIAVITYIMGLASKKFGWNKELAIPVQNFLIVITAFGLIVLFNWLTGQPIEANSIFTYILTSLGGVSIAASTYDFQKAFKKEE